MVRPNVLIVALALAPGLAAAQDGPSFECGAAESDAEMLICEDAALAALDRRLSDVFAAAMAAAEGLDTGAEEAAAELRTTQRGWIGGRDDCWKAEDLRACVETAYLLREGELVGRWMLQEPTATVFYDCEDGSAPVATFFDTAAPSVRIEYGDTVDVGVQTTPTASGARYDASFGTYLWTRGDEALFSIQGGAETTCTESG